MSAPSPTVDDLTQSVQEGALHALLHLELLWRQSSGFLQMAKHLTGLVPNEGPIPLQDYARIMLADAMSFWRYYQSTYLDPVLQNALTAALPSLIRTRWNGPVVLGKCRFACAVLALEQRITRVYYAAGALFPRYSPFLCIELCQLPRDLPYNKEHELVAVLRARLCASETIHRLVGTVTNPAEIAPQEATIRRVQEDVDVVERHNPEGTAILRTFPRLSEAIARASAAPFDRADPWRREEHPPQQFSRRVAQLLDLFTDVDFDSWRAEILWETNHAAAVIETHQLCDQPASAVRRNPAASRSGVETRAVTAANTDARKPDGTIESGLIWLRGAPYRLTPGLRNILGYLLTHPAAAEDDVIRRFGMSGSSHLHKRLKDLRDRLAVELKRSGWRLSIRTKDACISCEWRQVK